MNYFVLATSGYPETSVTAHVVGRGDHNAGVLGKADRIQKINLWKLEYDPVKEWDEKHPEWVKEFEERKKKNEG